MQSFEVLKSAGREKLGKVLSLKGLVVALRCCVNMVEADTQLTLHRQAPMPRLCAMIDPAGL